MWPFSAITLPIALATEASSSTLSSAIVTGSLSAETIFASSPALSKLRMVAVTLWPPRASVTAVANPMPLLDDRFHETCVVEQMIG
jgi:hypothetical protein